ncbi:MAG TPA: ion channel [Thermoleophilaceae bacterium]|nr:ion channel [Thermoleophilaceae bacterium]
MERPLEHRLQRLFDGATYVAALLTGPVLVALAFDLPSGVESALVVVNWACWAAFALELVTMLAVSRDRSAWLRSRPMTPVVVVLTLPAFEGLDVFRLVRLLRGPVARRVAEGVTTTAGLRNVAILTLLTVGLGGLLFAELEPGVDVGDGLYWAVTTATTTGYGDIVPTTEGGKALAMAVMVIGAAFLAILTGAIAQQFVGRWQRGRAESDERSPSAGTATAGEEAVLAKLDELGERLARLERAVSRG